MNRIVLLLALLVPGLSFAADGVLEINQTCAVETGCFSGDTAGLPVTITAAGSYRLTSNLRLFRSFGQQQTATFITIQADYVTLDLGGFRISCVQSLGGPCNGVGSGVVATPGTYGAALRNGSITGMADDGVFLARQAVVTNLRVHANGREGIRIGGGGGIVQGNTVLENGDYGLDLVFGTIYLQNVMASNATGAVRGGHNMGANFCTGPGIVSLSCP